MVSERPRDTTLIDYRPPRFNTQRQNTRSIAPLGLDTEADQDGCCFMICTSLGDVFTPDQFPGCLFSRAYRGQKFVTYNMKYDESALVQNLPTPRLKELWRDGRTAHDGYIWRTIPQKMLSIRKGKNTVTMYDLFNFFSLSLEKVSQLFLGEGKIDLDPKLFTPEYIEVNWPIIADYCIKDAQLVSRLAGELIAHLESFGVYPQKLYSCAYVGFQYFRTHTNLVTVKRFWNHYRGLLDYAMGAYAGGKFEVTWRGAGYLWEYDINSAYPFEIANLVDITHARVVHSARYLKDACYGFIKAEVQVPVDLAHPVPIPRGNINTFPAGEFTKIITKAEYEYLSAHGCQVKVLDGWYLYPRKIEYPYRDEVMKLYAEKVRAKAEQRQMDYELVKLILNSFYGKMVQLIKQGKRFRAGLSWNPIYAAVITANVRLRISEMQYLYPEVVAVHTDSIISRADLGINGSKALGDFALAVEGQGVILGSGIYQVGKESHFRGYATRRPLTELVKGKGRTLTFPTIRPLTWREVIFHSWDTSLINKFTEIARAFDLNFDSKRVWLDIWESADQVWEKEIESVPLVCSELLDF